jgi:hypothetical protein
MIGTTIMLYAMRLDMRITYTNFILMRMMRNNRMRQQNNIGNKDEKYG